MPGSVEPFPGFVKPAGELTQMFLKKQPGTIDLSGGRPDRKPPKIFVVVGDGTRAGTIKTLEFRKEVSTEILNVENVPGGYEIQIAAAYRRRNWCLLDDLYDQEGREEDKGRFHRFQENLAGRGPEVIKPSYMKCVVPGFPDERLPKRVMELAQGRNPLAGVYDPDADDFVDLEAPSEPVEAKPSKPRKGSVTIPA